jgi:hypothetical protein
MPMCWKCKTILPSAEVRRTPRGHLCKSKYSCTRRAAILLPPQGKEKSA